MPKEVADFLEQDRKRQQAQDKQDDRHLRVSLKRCCSVRNVSGVPWKMKRSGNLRLENLRKAVKLPGEQSRELIDLRYGRELTMEESGLRHLKSGGSKRLKTSSKLSSVI